MATALIQVKPEALQQIATKHADLLQQAQQLTIRDDASYRSAGELAMAIKALRDEIIADFAKPKKAAHDAHKAVCQQEKSHLEKLETPDKIVRQKLSAYAAEQERKRQDAEREAIAAARVKAEEEVIQRASDAYERGERSLAERILNGPVIPEAVAPVTITRPQAAGVAMVPKVEFKVIDESKMPRQFFTLDLTKVRKHCETFGEDAAIEGVLNVWVTMVPRIGGRIAEAKPVQSETAEVTADQIFG